jgi:hypothetical protein
MSGQDFSGAPEAQAAHYAQVAQQHARLAHLTDHWPAWQPVIAPDVTDPAHVRQAVAAWLGLAPA